MGFVDHGRHGNKKAKCGYVIERVSHQKDQFPKGCMIIQIEISTIYIHRFSLFFFVELSKSMEFKQHNLQRLSKRARDIAVSQLDHH